MEPLRQSLKVCRLGVAVLLVCMPSLGCVMTQQMQMFERPPHAPPCKVVATWYPQVAETEDPTHNGTPVKGIAGRVYLFDETMAQTTTNDGVLVVALWDAKAFAANKNAKPLEEWHFDKDSLKRLRRKDGFGWGYTVFLPWVEYKPEITQIRIRVRFEPTTGTPLFQESPEITLNKDIVMTSTSGSKLLTPGMVQAPTF